MYKEAVVSRIISGKYFFTLDNPYYFVNATLEDKYVANKIYEEKYECAVWMNMFTEDEFRMFLAELGHWTDMDEERLKQIGNEIEEFKVKLFELVFKSNERNAVRKALQIAKTEQSKLLARKHSYDHLTMEGFALSCKMRSLILNRLRDINFQKVKADHLFDRLIGVYNTQLLQEESARDICRTEPWRGVWVSSKKDASLFNCHPYELSDEQKMLYMWSITYDNIYQSPECPHETVIEDDDMLDGWMIIQKRKREKDLAKKEGDSLISNEKIRNADEIFILADTARDAAKIEALNDIGAKITKQKKMSLLTKLGTVKEEKMPDSRQKIMEAMAKGRKG